MGYLVKAQEIDKDNPKIQTTRDQLTDSQCKWYILLGDQADEVIGKIIDIYSSTADALDGHLEAKQQCQEHVIRAMNYYMLASIYKPNDYTILNKIRNIEKFGNWIAWNDEVRFKIASLHKMEQIQLAANRFNELQMKLIESRVQISKT